MCKIDTIFIVCVKREGIGPKIFEKEQCFRPTQGDQIGRIFAHCAILFFDSFFSKNAEEVQLFGLLFSAEKVMYVGINFDKKMGWDTFWAFFSQTH
jgi:hypothetical protein